MPNTFRSIILVIFEFDLIYSTAQTISKIMVLSIIKQITGIQTAEFRPRKITGYNKKTGRPRYDSPQGESCSGVLSILLGTLAIIFAGRNIKRLRRERQTIQKMWDENMTLQRFRILYLRVRPR